MPKTCRWISTRVEYEWLGDAYVKTCEEGYWYSGPLALATDPPTLECNLWALYEDGTESGSVIINTVNGQPSKGDLDYDTTYFARFDIEETAGNKSLNTDGQFQYRINTGGGFGSWTDVNATSSYIRTTPSASLSDGASTTQRLGGAYSFESGNNGVDNADGLSDGAGNDTQSNGFEFLFPFQIRSADVSEDDIIELRYVEITDGLDVVPTWPSITAKAASGEDTCLADNVESATAVSVPDVGQKHVLLANDASSATAVSVPSIGQNHILSRGPEILIDQLQTDDSTATGTTNPDWGWGASQVSISGGKINHVAGFAAIFTSDRSYTNGNLYRAEYTVESLDIFACNFVGHVLSGADLTVGSHVVEKVGTAATGSVLKINFPISDGSTCKVTAVSVKEVLETTVESNSSVSAPELGASDELLADDVESASAVSVPSVGQKHVLTAADAESASSVSLPGLSTPHYQVITPQGGTLTGLRGRVTRERFQSVYYADWNILRLGATGATEDTLLADNVESASELATVNIGQEHSLLAEDVESSSEVSTPAVGQEHTLLANDAESASELSNPAVGQVHGLLANDVESASAVSIPDISQVYALLAENVESATESAAVSSGQEHLLLADDVESTSAVSSNVLEQVHALTQAGAESTSAVSVPAVGQEHSLLADNAESASSLSVPSVGQEHILLADNAESSTELSLPSLFEGNVLLADDVESVSSVSVPAIGQEHILLANNAESSTELTSPAIGQEHGLLANNAESASQVSAPNLVDVPAGVNALLADDVESLTEVYAPSIGQIHVLLANDAESTSEVSAPNLVDVSFVPVPSQGGSGGGGTGRKYKKALREEKGKVRKPRIGRLEDYVLPNPRILIDELTEEIAEEVTKDIKREKPGITLRQLADVIAETKRILKEKKRLDELKRLIKIAYLKEISKRRKKKALLKAENLIKEEIYKVLEIKAERERIKAEKERKAKRQARDSKDLEVILYILAKVA